MNTTSKSDPADKAIESLMHDPLITKGIVDLSKGGANVVLVNRERSGEYAEELRQKVSHLLQQKGITDVTVGLR